MLCDKQVVTIARTNVLYLPKNKHSPKNKHTPKISIGGPCSPFIPENKHICLFMKPMYFHIQLIVFLKYIRSYGVLRLRRASSSVYTRCCKHFNTGCQHRAHNSLQEYM